MQHFISGEGFIRWATGACFIFYETSAFCGWSREKSLGFINTKLQLKYV